MDGSGLSGREADAGEMAKREKVVVHTAKLRGARREALP